jgi:hypothetical protein
MKHNTKKHPRQQAYESNPVNVNLKGWEWLFRFNRKPAILLLIIGIFGSIIDAGNMDSTGQPTNTEPDAPLTGVGEALARDPSVFVSIALLILGTVAVVLLLTVIINGMLQYISWKTSRGETTTISGAFKAVMGKFWTIAGVYALSLVKVIGGLLLFIVPGIRAALRYKLVALVVFEENLGGKAALRRIKNLTDKHLLEILGASTLAVLPFVGVVFDAGSEAVLFRQLKGLEDTGAEAPKTHWLNYLIPAFFGFVAAAAATAVITGSL